jgi:hypothetical protein
VGRAAEFVRDWGCKRRAFGSRGDFPPPETGSTTLVLLSQRCVEAATLSWRRTTTRVNPDIFSFTLHNHSIANISADG